MKQSNNNMDELSIDSATNEKVRIEMTNSGKQQKQQKKPHFRIDWRDLCYYQKPQSHIARFFNKINLSGETSAERDNLVSASTGGQPKQILNSLDGCFKSGQLSAILGPSGAGKSTFLSTLFGSKQEGAYGQTKVTWFTADGQLQSEKSKRAIRIASLPQHDHLLNHLTVYETLMFASKIKNPHSRKNTGKNFHRQNVKRVAKMLKISECLDTRCGKLSGGQYKRVSIGQELLSEPDVIILDEPTSGLDAMTCLTTVQTLKSIVMKHPMIIILTIHQPDIDVFNLFDHVYVIAQGGLAIYEGPPQNILSTLAEVDLKAPSGSYNPARFIVENAFVVAENNGQEVLAESKQATVSSAQMHSTSGSDEDDDYDDDDDGDDDDDYGRGKLKAGKQNYIKRSMLSLTEALSGKEMISGVSNNEKKRFDRKPLLNIGIQTLDGKLITSEQLAREKDKQIQDERWNLLKRLNQIQKAPYLESPLNLNPGDIISSDGQLSPLPSSAGTCQLPDSEKRVTYSPDGSLSLNCNGKTSHYHEDDWMAKSDYSSSGWSDSGKRGATVANGGHQGGERTTSGRSTAASFTVNRLGKASSLAHLDDINNPISKNPTGTDDGSNGEKMIKSEKLTSGRSLQAVNSNQQPVSERESISSSPSNDYEGDDQHGEIQDRALELPPGDQLAINFTQKAPRLSLSYRTHRNSVASSSAGAPPSESWSKKSGRMKRQFDKRLSAKHNCSKQKDHPIYYHAFLLTHRTWLSIVRDPIFFGIQACMHTIIPVLLALIFGSSQEEGCPRVGSFDLVEFAYSDAENMILNTVSSIRNSIGNIGIVFFEMFVLSFSINCITALVFPLDMYVLLKEYRNGWYSLRSYFFGRTLADLPVPIVLHSIGMAILYFLTGQPHSMWRFGAIIVLVILSSLVAQSIGLTIGALLMKSSQSAVLTAAGIVAPFFALSGFIVRIHTLPSIAQIAAKGSYLYHLLNGFIILRYGYGRCQCHSEDFEKNEAHQIPSNLHTLASMWIGTYSNEYPDSAVMKTGNSTNRTNVDPNIDVVDKMMTAFKMANSYGHQIQDCDDVLPYAMLDFNLRDKDIYWCFMMLVIMLLVSRFITFTAIYYKIRSFT